MYSLQRNLDIVAVPSVQYKPDAAWGKVEYGKKGGLPIIADCDNSFELISTLLAAINPSFHRAAAAAAEGELFVCADGESDFGLLRLSGVSGSAGGAAAGGEGD